MLILETGDGNNPFANTYVTDDFFTAFIGSRIQTEGDIIDAELPESLASREVLLMKSMDYLEGLSTQFVGQKRTYEQPLQWPRNFVSIDGFDVVYTEIPKELRYAQCFLAYAAINIDILRNHSDDGGQRYVTKEEVYQAVTVEYRKSANYATQAILTKANVYLRKLLINGGVSVRS